MIRPFLFALIVAGWCQVAKSQPAPLETGFVPGGVPIYYQIHGAIDGPPVVFMHGFGGYFDGARIEWLVDALSEYKLIGMDVRGHGRSGKPVESDDYGLAVVEDVNRLLHHLELDDAHVIGFSMGALVGLKHATLFPNRVRSLTMVGQGLAPQESFEEWIQMGKDVMALDERSADQEDNISLYSGFLQGYLPIMVPDADAKALKVPLLIVIGEEDERLDIARNLKQQYPAAKLLIAPGYNHSTIATKDSPFTLSVIGFLKRQED